MNPTNGNDIFPISYLYRNEKERADKVYLRQPIDGEYQEYTWSQCMNMARRIANFLKEQGLQPGDRVASLSKNCMEWFITDFAILMAGMVSVPLYATQSGEDIAFVLKHSDSRMLFVGKLDNWSHQEPHIPKEIKRIAYPYKNPMPADFQWKDIIENTQPLKENHQPNIDDLMTIIYTSGTTVNPKGVSITYKVANDFYTTLQEDLKTIDLPEEHHFISYLPLAHVVERFAIEFFSIDQASDVSFVESLETFATNLKQTSPTLFFAVPRIWSVFQSHILQKLPQKKLNILLKIPVLSSIIKKKVKAGLGLTRSVLNISGAAPISADLLVWYEKLGIKIEEGYGQTENCAYATLNKPGASKVGTVGKPRVNVEVKIGDNKELMVKSPGTMLEYYLEPEKTKNTLAEDGWLNSGDQAEIDDEGFVTIIGRVKDQFKTSKGEYVAPTPIEHKFVINENIEQCCLYGRGIKQPILIMNLSEGAKKRSKKIVEKSLRSDLHRINQELSNFEKISHIFITEDDWTPENEFMTATLKLRRNRIENKYNTRMESLQNEENMIAWESPAEGK